VDKTNGYTQADSFSKQLPFYAVEEKSRATNSGVGAPGSYANANSLTHLQTWTMINHDDRNTIVAEEFGYFLDGTKVPAKNWASGEPAAGKHFVHETSDGKWKTADENTNFTCTTCELGTGE